MRVTAYATSLLATVALALACQWPGLGSNPLLVSINTADSVLCVGAAFFLYRTPARRPLGIAMAICGPLYSAQFLTTWNTGPWPLLGGAASASFFLVGGVAVLIYPHELKTDRWELPAILGQVIINPLAQAGVSLFTSRYSNNFAPSVWWHQIAPSWNHANGLLTVLNIWAAIAEVLFVVGVSNRIRRATTMDRYVLIPFGISTILVGATSQATAGYEFFPRLSAVFLPEGLVVAAVPLCVVAVLFWQDVTHVRVASTLSRAFASTSVTTSGLQALLADALSDDSLEIAYWSDERSSYITSSGQVTSYVHLDARLGYAKELTTLYGSPLAVVTGSAFLRRHEGIVETALNASSVALENARLQANLLAQVDEIKQSRQRVAEAALAERQRIERDIHDGLQQRLLAVSMRLGLLTSELEGHHETKAQSINDDVIAANAELRNLVRGILPPELSQSGLGPTLREVLRGISISADLTVEVDRLPSAIEGTAYFLISEAVSNAVKYSQARHLDVRVMLVDSFLKVAVADDGIGGADKNGHGLQGLQDRVAAFDGTLSVESGSQGTTLIALIPVPA